MLIGRISLVLTWKVEKKRKYYQSLCVSIRSIFTVFLQTWPDMAYFYMCDRANLFMKETNFIHIQLSLFQLSTSWFWEYFTMKIPRR